MSKNKEKPVIAIIGTRGVPARYGGFETFAEELGKRIALRGYEIRVYGRKYGFSSPFRSEANVEGIKSIILPAIKHKYLETPVHSLFSFLDLIFNRVDFVILCNAANSPFAFIVRLLRIPLVINVDGIEKERRKWNLLGKLWYSLGEATSSLFADKIITDADYIDEYYRNKFAVTSEVIRYGARIISAEVASKKISGDYSFLSDEERQLLNSYGIKPGEYLLYVSRLEPENNADKVIKAYNFLSKEDRERYPLVIVGDAPYAESFKHYIKEIAESEVIFLGYRFALEYETLQKGAYAYIQATEVGGTHPALVEAMGFANYILANDVPEHRETIGDSGVHYRFNDINDLSSHIKNIIDNQEVVSELRAEAYNRALELYSWDSITDKYLGLMGRILGVDKSGTL